MFKRLILSTITVLVSLCVFAQKNDGPVMDVSKTVEIEGASKAELYNRATAWFYRTFRSGKNVLELQDKEAGMITGKGVIAYDAPAFSPGTNFTGYFYLTMAVDVKDGKYRYRIENISHEALKGGVWSVDLRGKRHVLRKVRERANDEVAKLAESLEAGMQKTYKDDNW